MRAYGAVVRTDLARSSGRNYVVTRARRIRFIRENIVLVRDVESDVNGSKFVMIT